MSVIFLDKLTQQTGKRIALSALRTLWLDTFPEQVSTPDRDHQLLRALKQGEGEGRLQLPGPLGFEKLGNPPMPKSITLIREVAEG